MPDTRPPGRFSFSFAKSSRPRLDLPRTPIETAIDLIGIAGMAVVGWLLISSWDALPDRVPFHFGFDGRPDEWGEKTMLLLMPVVLFALYVGLTVLWRHPHAFNYPWPITDENAPAQYRLGRMLIAIIKVEIVWLSVGILYAQIQSATSRSGLPVVFLPAAVGVILLTIAGYFVMARRRR